MHDMYSMFFSTYHYGSHRTNGKAANFPDVSPLTCFPASDLSRTPCNYRKNTNILFNLSPVTCKTFKVSFDSVIRFFQVANFLSERFHSYSTLWDAKEGFFFFFLCKELKDNPWTQTELRVKREGIMGILPKPFEHDILLVICKLLALCLIKYK